MPGYVFDNIGHYKEKGAGVRSFNLIKSGLVFYAIAAFEAFYPPRRIHDTLLSCEKGMAFGANFHFYQWFGSAGYKIIATGTSDLGIIIVFGMNLIFHWFSA
jgi:hypothetical protein